MIPPIQKKNRLSLTLITNQTDPQFILYSGRVWVAPPLPEEEALSGRNGKLSSIIASSFQLPHIHSHGMRTTKRFRQCLTMFKHYFLSMRGYWYSSYFSHIVTIFFILQLTTLKTTREESQMSNFHTTLFQNSFVLMSWPQGLA
jgi:hypothetical protein